MKLLDQMGQEVLADAVFEVGGAPVTLRLEAAPDQVPRRVALTLERASDELELAAPVWTTNAGAGLANPVRWLLVEWHERRGLRRVRALSDHRSFRVSVTDGAGWYPLGDFKSTAAKDLHLPETWCQGVRLDPLGAETVAMSQAQVFFSGVPCDLGVRSNQGLDLGYPGPRAEPVDLAILDPEPGLELQLTARGRVALRARQVELLADDLWRWPDTEPGVLQLEWGETRAVELGAPEASALSSATAELDLEITREALLRPAGQPMGQALLGTPRHSPAVALDLGQATLAGVDLALRHAGPASGPARGRLVLHSDRDQRPGPPLGLELPWRLDPGADPGLLRLQLEAPVRVPVERWWLVLRTDAGEVHWALAEGQGSCHQIDESPWRRASGALICRVRGYAATAPGSVSVHLGPARLEPDAPGHATWRYRGPAVPLDEPVRLIVACSAPTLFTLRDLRLVLVR